MSRYIDADAYAEEMKTRQDALKELMDDADALDNWEMHDGLSRAFSVFVEAKLTLDAMPTVDAVPVVRCRECIHQMTCGFVSERPYKSRADWFCADGERRSDD